MNTHCILESINVEKRFLKFSFLANGNKIAVKGFLSFDNFISISLIDINSGVKIVSEEDFDNSEILAYFLNHKDDKEEFEKIFNSYKKKLLEIANWYIG